MICLELKNTRYPGLVYKKNRDPARTARSPVRAADPPLADAAADVINVADVLPHAPEPCDAVVAELRPCVAEPRDELLLQDPQVRQGINEPPKRQDGHGGSPRRRVACSVRLFGMKDAHLLLLPAEFPLDSPRPFFHALAVQVTVELLAPLACHAGRDGTRARRSEVVPVPHENHHDGSCGHAADGCRVGLGPSHEGRERDGEHRDYRPPAELTKEEACRQLLVRLRSRRTTGCGCHALPFRLPPADKNLFGERNCCILY